MNPYMARRKILYGEISRNLRPRRQYNTPAQITVVMNVKLYSN